MFIGFQLVTLTGENQVHWLIIQLIQKELLVIMYSKKPQNQASHSHTLS